MGTNAPSRSTVMPPAHADLAASPPMAANSLSVNGVMVGLGRPAAALARRGAAVLARGGMKIYTKAGDGGETGLFGGPRVAKDDARVEAYGAVDELGAALGVARARGLDPEL